MPYQWVDPDKFLEHLGVAVYHCYDEASMKMSYIYTVDPSDCDADNPLGEAQFDVRDVFAVLDREGHFLEEYPNLDPNIHSPDFHREVIERAIHNCLIDRDGFHPDEDGAELPGPEI